jgi:hypothetical protein
LACGGHHPSVSRTHNLMNPEFELCFPLLNASADSEPAQQSVNRTDDA